MADGTPIFGALLRPRQGTKPVDTSVLGDSYQKRLDREAAQRQFDENVNQKNLDREAAQMSEARKAKDKRIQDIAKNSVFNQEFHNPYFQRLNQKNILSGMDDIIQAAGQGDDNSLVLAYNKLNELKALVTAYKQNDLNWKTAQDAYAKDSSKYALADEHSIGKDGRTYYFVWDALNDPANDSPELQEEILSKFTSPWFNPVALGGRNGQVGLPEYVMPINLANAEINNPFKEMVSSIPDEAYTVMNESAPSRIPGTNRTIIRKSISPHPDIVYLAATNLGANRATHNALINNEYQRIKQEKRQQGVDYTYSMFMGENDIQKISMNGMKGLREAALRLTKQLTPEGGTSPSQSTTSQKNAEKMIPSGEFTFDGQVLKIPISGVAQQDKAIEMPKGALYRTGPNQEYKVTDKPYDIKATPIRIEWGSGLKDSFIIYNSKSDPKGISGGDKTYNYKVPLTRTSLGQAAAVYGTNTTDMVEQIRAVGQGGPVEKVNEFVKALGMDASQIPGPGTGQSSTPASGSITIELNGKTGSIPAENWEAFKKKYPNAIRK